MAEFGSLRTFVLGEDFVCIRSETEEIIDTIIIQMEGGTSLRYKSPAGVGPSPAIVVEGMRANEWVNWSMVSGTVRDAMIKYATTTQTKCERDYANQKYRVERIGSKYVVGIWAPSTAVDDHYHINIVNDSGLVEYATGSLDTPTHCATTRGGDIVLVIRDSDQQLRVIGIHSSPPSAGASVALVTINGMCLRYISTTYGKLWFESADRLICLVGSNDRRGGGSRGGSKCREKSFAKPVGFSAILRQNEIKAVVLSSVKSCVVTTLAVLPIIPALASLVFEFVFPIELNLAGY